MPWTKPEDLPFDPGKPIRPLLSNHHGGGFLVAMADGSIHFVLGASERTLQAAITTCFGDVLGPDW